MLHKCWGLTTTRPFHRVLQVAQRAFSNATGAGSSSQPGFLTHQRMRELQRLPKLLPEPLRKVLSQQPEYIDEFKPDLTRVGSIVEAESAIKRHVNQEPVNIMQMLRIATRPTLSGHPLEQMSFSEIARNIFGREALEGEEEEEDGGEFLLDGAEDGEETGALKEHIDCSSVLKKRRRRMRRQKHKKRLRKNRYKAD